MPDRNINIPMVYVPLYCGNDVCLTTDIKAAYDLEQGNYRFVKNLYFRDYKEMVRLALPFELTNSILFEEGISITLNSYENGKLAYTIENQSNSQFYYNSYCYSLEKEVDGKWVTVSSALGRVVPDVIEILSPESKVSQVTYIQEWCDLQPGNYRVSFNFRCANIDETVWIGIPFKVIE